MESDKYRHEHERSSEWFKKNFLDFADERDDGHRDVHHHRIVDRESGKTGEGWGWSYKQAEKQAWADLNRR